LSDQGSIARPQVSESDHIFGAKNRTFWHAADVVSLLERRAALDQFQKVVQCLLREA
jgi:hypothetical protein